MGPGVIAVAYLAVLSVSIGGLLISKRREVWLPAIWCALLLTILNIVSLLYFFWTGDQSVFWGLAPAQIAIGAELNLAFLAFWAIGYWSSISLVRIRFRKPTRSELASQRTVLSILFLVSLFAYIAFLRAGYHYGYSQYLYAFHPEDVGAFGVTSFFAKLAVPLSAALLLYTSFAGDGRTTLWRWCERALWTFLACTIVAGGAIFMQRSQLLLPVVAGGLVLLLSGRWRTAVVMGSAGIVAIIALSPVIDAARASRGLASFQGEVGSFQGFATALEQYAKKGRADTPEATLRDDATKSLLPVSSFLLYQKSQISGHVGLASYPSVFIDLAPRILVPSKPYPLSVDGTPWGRPTFVVGQMLGHPGVTYWVDGGGVMYWQLGWFGILMGGLLVGVMWGWMCWYALRSRSMFAVVIFLLSFGDGTNLFQSVDYVLHEMLRAVVLMVPFILAAHVIKRVPANSRGAEPPYLPQQARVGG